MIFRKYLFIWIPCHTHTVLRNGRHWTVSNTSFGTRLSFQIWFGPINVWENVLFTCKVICQLIVKIVAYLICEKKRTTIFKKIGHCQGCSSSAAATTPHVLNCSQPDRRRVEQVFRITGFFFCTAAVRMEIPPLMKRYRWFVSLRWVNALFTFSVARSS